MDTDYNRLSTTAETDMTFVKAKNPAGVFVKVSQKGEEAKRLK